MTPSLLRPNWYDYWMDVAFAVSKRADCSRRQVGAVIVDTNNRIVSTGYNGSPPGGPSCLAGQCPRAQSNVAPGSSYDTGAGSCIANHAEGNAIIWADPIRLNGATLYITDEPCEGCARLIRGVNITQVHWLSSS
jgi:dCMP deaminase